MRIGILTLPLHFNYGGILQAYALQTVLERMGHEVTLIERKQKPYKIVLWKIPLSYSKRLLKKLSGYKTTILLEKKLNNEFFHNLPIIQQHTDKFISKYIKRKFYDDFCEIKENDYDAIIVGSDQIWRPLYYPKIEDAFLNFTKNWDILRIAYAASFGTDRWEYTLHQTKRCGKLLHKFNLVSVRELSGIKLCNVHWGLSPELVLDPTLLLDVKEYVSLFRNTNTPPRHNNLLCYILDETKEKQELIKKIADEKNLNIFRVNSYAEDRDADLKNRIQPPVEYWLRGFYDAEFIITDSFHACVFSIIFKKPFIAYGNSNRGLTRFSSLLTIFGLQDRLITKIEQYKSLKDIDYEYVYNILDEKRNESIKILSSAISHKR